MEKTEHRLITRWHVHERMHGSGAIGRFNRWLAVNVTHSVGTMWCAYVFMLIALVSMPAAVLALLNGDTLSGVAWLSQSFLQLVLLPIIIVGQTVNGAAADGRAEADHEALQELLRRTEHAA